ncbi:MAG: hypothetical protein E7076_04585 [Bacteroidales bacterium]|nr:hypothetical protein [Bacteroidales bacterium]
MKKITLLMMLAAMLTNGWAQDLITPHQDNSVSGTENGHAWVDLGLPSGLKWATCNVGAENPWDYGDYFAWGETIYFSMPLNDMAYHKYVYNWSTYLDSRITCTEDCGTEKDLLRGIDDIKGTQYDAARANMGGSWRMPTLKEIHELVHECYWEWTSSYNVKGLAGYIVYKVKDASDKGKEKNSDGSVTTVGSYSLSDTHIFLPAAGFRYEFEFLYVGTLGGYWSSSLNTDSQNYVWTAWRITFGPDHPGLGSYDRCSGQCVRGVVDPSVCTITVTSNNSQYGTVSGGGLYAANSTATLSAMPYEDYKFVQWSDGNKENPRQIVVMSDMTYTAVFEEDADGIADIIAAGINIYTAGKTIIVENATEAITVSDALGRLVGKDDAQIVPAETRKFPVPSSGVYVVKIGNRAASVLVR